MTLISRFPKRFPSSLPKARGLLQQLFRPRSYGGTPSDVSQGAGSPRAPAGLSVAGFSSLASAKTFAADAVRVDGQSARAIPRPATPVVPTATTGVVQLQPQQPQPQPQLNLYGPRSADWWTGKAPVVGVCPGMRSDGSLCSLPQLSLASGACTRETLQAYFDNTWTMTEVLMSSLQGEEAFVKSPYHDLRHPLIFYYGHPACLYINKLRVAGLLTDPINSYYESVFETGVDEMSWDDLSKNKMPWPTVADVHHYRKQVYAKVSDVIAKLTDEQCATAGQSSPVWALAMAFEHERIHLETSSVLITELPQHLVKFPKHFPPYHAASIPSTKDEATQHPVAAVHYPINEMIAVSPKVVTLGKPRDYPSFGWDNEYGHREYEVPAFSGSKFKVSNGEFLEFVRDGGYAKRELWTDEGWEWRAYRNAKWPSFWVRSGPQGLHHFDLRVIFDTIPMPWSWPASVNYHEAHAYAAWLGKKQGKNIRVMTELEHKAIRDPVQVDELTSLVVDPVMQPLGPDKFMMDSGVNTNLSCGSMTPVDQNKPNKQGFHDVFGNAWEWTADYFCALPGFEVHGYYEDFSTPCFDGLHHVIQGGSFMSTGNESSHFSRFHFRPHFFQHASFRIVEQSAAQPMLTSDTDAPGPFVGSYPFRRSNAGLQNAVNSREDSKSKAQYDCLKHYGSIKRLQNVFASSSSMEVPSIRAISSTIIKGAKQLGIPLASARAIDVGCGPGALTFELGAKVKSVIGIDHSFENIKLAKTLHTEKKIPATFAFAKSEGEIVEQIPITTTTPPSETGAAAHLEFRMADPMSLPAEMMGFDIVVLNDVVDKIASPNSLLGRLGGVRGLVRSNGLLAVSSSFSWNSDITPKSLWLGGYTDPKTGQPVSSLATLAEKLEPDFELVQEESQPVFWQESTNDFRCKFLSVSLWRRK